MWEIHTRYIFIPFEFAIFVLHRVWHIIELVRFGEEIERVSDRVIQAFLVRCGGTDVLPPELVPAPYQRGQRVHVTGTSVASGHSALFESVVGDGKLRLLFDMMGRYIPIDVDERDVSELPGNESAIVGDHGVAEHPLRREARRLWCGTGAVSEMTKCGAMELSYLINED
jgi:hypothetical protein